MTEYYERLFNNLLTQRQDNKNYYRLLLKYVDDENKHVENETEQEENNTEENEDEDEDEETEEKENINFSRGVKRASSEPITENEKFKKEMNEKMNLLMKYHNDYKDASNKKFNDFKLLLTQAKDNISKLENRINQLTKENKEMYEFMFNVLGNVVEDLEKLKNKQQ